MWKTGGGNNDTGWGNEEYDWMLSQALAAPNDEERFKVYNRMEKILIDEMPVLPIYHYTNSKLISPKVLGYKITPLDNFPWKFVDLASAP